MVCSHDNGGDDDNTKNIGGYAYGMIDSETDIMTFVFLQSYFTAEAFETQLVKISAESEELDQDEVESSTAATTAVAKTVDITPPIEPIPCPEISENTAWASSAPCQSILEPT